MQNEKTNYIYILFILLCSVKKIVFFIQNTLNWASGKFLLVLSFIFKNRFSKLISRNSNKARL